MPAPQRARKKPNHSPLKLFLSGSSGRMGTEIKDALSNQKRFELVGASNSEMPVRINELAQADVICDFSSPPASSKLLEALNGTKGKAVLLGTTGLPPAVLKKWEQVATKDGHRVHFAPNTSQGIFVVCSIIGNMAKALITAGFDIEVIETHHRLKQDAPSGTAILLTEFLRKELPDYKIVTKHEGKRLPKSLGVHAVRGGGVVGEHCIRFIGNYEEVAISHRAFSRELFARGALELAGRCHAIQGKGLFFLHDLMTENS